MNYLFFDVESIDIHHKTICSFGYVLTDNNFNILEKDDILINPNITKDNIDSWSLNKIVKYPLDKFLKSPTFIEVFPKIERLLKNPENLLFGFSIDNEKIYLNSEFSRYNLPNLKEQNINIFDIQTLHKLIRNNKNVSSLKKCIEEFNINPLNFKSHNSCDDSEMSMIVAKNLCLEFNKTLEDLIKEYLIKNNNNV